MQSKYNKPYFFFHIYDPLNIPCFGIHSCCLQIPMKCLLQFINISHLADIFVLLHLWPLIDSLFGRHIYFFLFMPISFEILHTCVYIQNTNAHEVFRWQCQIFYISKPYLFFHIYDPLNIPCLAVISTFFQMPMKCLPQFITISYLAAIFVLNIM